MLARVLRGALGLLALGMLLACEPAERLPPRDPKSPRCPPPPEPAYQAAVVGTIGKLHLVESRYPISKLGDVLAAFKPDLLLVGVRVDPFREGHLDQDLGAAEAPAEPWDGASIAKREGALLAEPRLFTFETANSQELAQKILLATDADARHRGGNPLLTRRHAWMQHLAASAVDRRARPKKVLAYVDVLDRPTVDALLHGLGYAMKEPAALVAKAKEEIISAIPGDVLDDWCCVGQSGVDAEK